jgi:hypothetical protein
LLVEGFNLYSIGRDSGTEWKCIVIFNKLSAYATQLLVEKIYIYILSKVSSGRVGPQAFKLDRGSGIL